jgi:flagellar protein FliS
MNYGAGYAYRQHLVEGASPVGLVVLLYGTIVASLLRAQEAVKQGNIEKRVNETNHVLAVIGQLQGTLDHKRGGDVAVQLDNFYNVMRARVLEASIKSSKEILGELIQHFTTLKEAWQQVERETQNPTGVPMNSVGTTAAQASASY